MHNNPIALTIAGSDPSGGAGIQADLKTFHQHQVYGTSAITLLTVQNTVNVEQVAIINAKLVAAQIQAVLNDIPPHAIKTGALGNASVIEAVAEVLGAKHPLLVIDPVMVSKHNKPLMNPADVEVFTLLLLPQAYLITPNIPEAEILTGMKITNMSTLKQAAEKILQLGAKNVLIKGGHKTDVFSANHSTDILVNTNESHCFEHTRVDTQNTHGTGCTFSAAITAQLARGLSLKKAVSKSKSYISRAIATNPQLGQGFGPVNHFVSIE